MFKHIGAYSYTTLWEIIVNINQSLSIYFTRRSDKAWIILEQGICNVPYFHDVPTIYSH